nr:putative DMBT1-like protein [Nothobranchius furzeri]
MIVLIVCVLVDYPIRLVKGKEKCSGRVEIFYSGSWGTVCDDYWDMNDAKVACSQLGCGPVVNATTQAYFGEGTGQIWLDDVGCLGMETSLTRCSNRGFGTHNCVHGEDAGVVCESKIGFLLFSSFTLQIIQLIKAGCIILDSCAAVRTVDYQSSFCSGRVEIYYQNEWGTVCSSNWNLNDAEVVCRQLGCGPAISPNAFQMEQGTGKKFPP